MEREYRFFLREALQEIEQFVDYVDQKMAVLGGRPVYMPYSDKGGEGKSYMTRLLTEWSGPLNVSGASRVTVR